MTPEEREIIERMELHARMEWPGHDRMAAGLRLIRDLQARLAAAEADLSVARESCTHRTDGGWGMRSVWSAHEPFATQDAAWQAWLDYHRRANDGQGQGEGK